MGTTIWTNKWEQSALQMRIIARKTLREFWERYPDSEEQLKAWCAEAKHAAWRTPADVKARYPKASILKHRRAVFNICGNKHRLVVEIHYDYQVVYIRFVGTHADYDAIDAETIG